MSRKQGVLGVSRKTRTSKIGLNGVVATMYHPGASSEIPILSFDPDIPVF